MQTSSQVDIRSYFRTIHPTSQGFKARCPRCERPGMRLHWNIEKRVGCCFTNLCQWYYEKGGVTENRLRAFFGDKPTFNFPSEIQESKIEGTIALPKEFKLLADSKDSEFCLAYNYLKNRGISYKAVKNAMVGYCKTGKFYGYFIFPVIDNGEVVYWQGRRFKNREPKFYNPASSKKADLLYEMPSFKRPDRIVLVESVINALTLDSCSGNCKSKIFALLGSGVLSNKQVDTIMSYERWAREIVIALDPDAWRRSCDIARILSGIFQSVKLALFPQSSDINSVGRELAWKAIDSALLYNRNEHIKMLQTGDRLINGSN